ncbi:hypothetical protein KY495_00675 [Massilia sp. PAMC28688]|uniref:hypothetical protein n=1 Tax=Massilia sp. PAMC28688 TaxID=2861283 RepID=UPI001C626983|nr:hypothetical protein [Massilia sp. PAMC28688]QYF93790.1 hypothetical protein KY495_00675 [Massilia sp. PAMC28688]
MVRMMTLAAFLYALALPACALETRAATDAERAAFADFYRSRFPGAKAPGPVFTIERGGPGQPWRLTARVDAQARRAARGLCRMERMRFVFGSEWAMERPIGLAWFHPVACAAAPPQHILILQSMPDTDVTALAAHAPAVLKRARLLFAGNTSCAVQRSLPFRLHAIDVGAPVSGGEEMAELIFRSDRHTSATVWVRRSGLAYDPWNVSCN